MLKVQLLCRGDNQALEPFLEAAFAEERLGEVEGILRWQINIADRDVADAAGRRIGEAAYSALLSFWLDSSQTQASRCCLQLQERLPDGLEYDSYLVEEAIPLESSENAVKGQRQQGFTQVALLQCPEQISYQQWYGHWKQVHTSVAIQTQATTRYIQNRVLAVLSPASPALDAIVEETFPLTAMSDDAAFYDAVGQSERLQKHVEEMMTSCAAFIDFERLAVFPSSEYRFTSATSKSES
ncbi:EthD domain-containing protein [Spongiibacter sp. KMU-158]|uniref:EthD domain-containing protein n=1 Tax=Spongiibacter pelagi TaxID=2760804 RepID=A0A927C1Z9_9GAMM|nr:EthD domain-containing protein [Spongiibacter pelagi]MBD2858562.1 EthD domain-containing protein [Spongiibacter pelagi]